MVSTLPARPLSLSEVHALAESSAVRDCKPLVAFHAADPTDEVIICALETDTGSRLLGFDTRDDSWTVIETLSASLTTIEIDALAEHVLEWATSRYDSSDIVVLAPNHDDSFAAILPPHPIWRDDIPRLESLPGVDAIHPMFCREATHEIVALLTFQILPGSTDDLVLANYGFHPELDEWHRIEQAAFGDSDQVDAPEDLDIHDWIEQQYNMAELLAISPDPV